MVGRGLLGAGIKGQIGLKTPGEIEGLSTGLSTEGRRCVLEPATCSSYPRVCISVDKWGGEVLEAS